ncbi:MAG: T9SS type A sorting domain-containing protein [Candidatus Cloacimonetes bacterium]|nr:T9SS type A sorting domain-containing protein [Candidatus Cloacimonadota bacterium]
MKTRILSLSFLLLSSALLGGTIVDTLFIVEEISVSFQFDQNHNLYNIFTPPMNFLVGDGWDWFEFYYFASYVYLTFECPDIPVGYMIDDAQLHLKCFAMNGNDEFTYPVFDPDNGESYNPYLMLDHLDYGYTLDLSDLDIPPNQLDPPCYILNDMQIGWLVIDVTDFLVSDIAENRFLSQYRLRLQNDSDWDPYYDYIHFYSQSPGNRPYIRCQFSDGSSTDDGTVSDIPEDFGLTATPNPFNPTTEISFSLPNSGDVRLTVFNLKGQAVTILYNEYLDSGRHYVTWDGKDRFGRPVASGVYLYRLRTNDGIVTKKMMLLQ